MKGTIFRATENLKAVSQIAQYIKCSSSTIGSIKVSKTSHDLLYNASFKDTLTGAKLTEFDVETVVGECNRLAESLQVVFDEVEVTFNEYYYGRSKKEERESK